MGRIIAIAGLPSSGKTTFGRELAKHLGAPLIDDPIKFCDVETVCRGNVGKTVIVTDPWFCVTDVRAQATLRFEKLGFTIEWIFFANDPEACKDNELRRGTGRENDIDWFSLQYLIPSGENTVPVWKEVK